MPRISADRLASRKNNIVAAARAVFTEHGYEKSTMIDIARQAGVSDGLAYRYFTSKRDLLQAVLDEFYARIIAHNEACVSREIGFIAKLETMIREHVRLLVEDTGLVRLFITEVRSLEGYQGSRTHELNRRYTSILTDILAEGMDQGIIDSSVEGRLVRDMIFGCVEHLAWRRILSGQPVDVEGVAKSISKLLLRGMDRGT